MRTRLSALAMLMFLGVFLVPTAAGDNKRKPPTPKPPDKVKQVPFVVPPFGTIKGTIIPAPPGYPASNGNLIVTVYKKLPVNPGRRFTQDQWEELKTTKIPVKMGQNGKGPWPYKFTVVPANVSLKVFGHFDGKWSVPTDGGVLGSKEGIILKPLEEKTVDLWLKPVIIG